MEEINHSELKGIHEDLQLLKNRLSIVEKILRNLDDKKIQIQETTVDQSDDDFDLSIPFVSKGSIEFGVGEYGMAWLGNIVLLLGIAFLVQYLQNSGMQMVSILAGFLSVAGIYFVSYFTRSSYSYLSNLFVYTGHLLLYYMTVQLHFFQTNPLIKSRTAGLFILMVIMGILFYQSLRKKSQLMAGLVLLMMLITGVIGNSVGFSAFITTITASLAIILYYRFGWIKLVFIFIFLVYIAHLNWILNNPFMGNKLELGISVNLSYLYFFATAAIFSLLALKPKVENVSTEFIITSVVFNGIGFTSILAVLILTYFSDNYVGVFSSIAVFCLIYSVILQSRKLLKITVAMYALYGFFALSVSLYGIFGLPESYMLFSLQSLLVVSMALWFRSRYIVLMNTLLFFIFMVFYLIDWDNNNITSFSFMLVAFISARVINWKKERLTLKTEVLRDLYLIAGFIMTLIAFYQTIPSSYITVSWILVAILFFILSLLMKNIKYRWLAIASVIASSIKLIFFDMSNIDIGYRVLVFLLLALISITLSVLYTKYLKKRSNNK